MSRLMLSAVLLAASPLLARAATITQFNFNSTVNDAATSTGSTLGSTGVGTATGVGGVTTSFSSGSPSDTTNTTDNSALAFTAQPAQGTNNKTAGVAFTTSTTGFNTISVSFDLRASGTASRYYQLQATTDGVTFNDVTGGTATQPTTAGTVAITSSVPTGSIDNSGFIDLHENSGSQVFIFPYAYTFAASDAVSNNPLFGVRLVTAYAPGTTGYAASSDASTYGTAGNTRIDNVTINGTALTAVPEPASLAVLGLAAAAGLRRRSR